MRSSFAGGRLTWAAAVAVTAATIAACSGGDVTLHSPASAVQTTTSLVTTAPSTTAKPTTTTTIATTTSTTLAPSEVVLETMSVEDKVGQLLMPLLAGTSAGEVTAAESAANVALSGLATPQEIVAQFRLGGVIYLGHNIQDAAQVAALSSGLQAAATQASSPGLLLGIDQEGGRVVRITDGVTPVPSARSFAGDTAAIEASALLSGQELQTQGFNLVFAPVADLADGNAGVIGDRSYSADPQQAASAVAAAIRGFEQSGIAASVKHWPGHGATTVDSHQSLPTVQVTYDEWVLRERVPFVAALEAGVEVVMVGHLYLPGLDDQDRASSVSPVIINQLLRDELGFAGVVVTDALDMGAVSSIQRGELAVAAIEAGVDLLLAPPDLLAAQEALLAAVTDGRITIERLDEAVLRILRLKERLGLLSEVRTATGLAEPAGSQDTLPESQNDQG